MPRLEDIEQFASKLYEAGHEPEVLAEKGETLEPVPRPEEGLSADLAELFEGIPLDEGTVEPTSEEASEEIPLDQFLQEKTTGVEFEGTSPGEPLQEEGLPVDFEEELPSEGFPQEGPSKEPYPPSIEEGLSEPLEFSFEEEVPVKGGPEQEPSLEEFEMPEFPVVEEEAPAQEEGEAPTPEKAETAEEFPFPEEVPFEESLLPKEGAVSTEEVVPGKGIEETPSFEEGFFFEESKVEAEPSVQPPPSVEAPMEERGEKEEGELEEISVDELGGEEFSLGDFGAEFGLLEAEEAKEEEPTINIPAGAAEVIAAVAEEEEFSLSDEEFERFKKTLSDLPLNLRRAIEEVVGGNKATDEDQIKLIRYLLAGESLSTIASFTGKLLGRPIKVPKGYEKRTGYAYEAEKETLAYILREKFLPILRLALASALATGVLFYGAYLYIYRPLYARSLFRQGYALIESDRYREGNGYFERAYRIWDDKEWYFRYADLFVKKKQYALAQAKYEELLAHYADYIHPRTKIWTERKKDSYFERGVLSYGDLESRVLENYEKAEKILKKLLNVDLYHWQGLLALGDNYLRWADVDPQKYQEARKTYGTLLQRYGDKDTILFRFLELFILTDEFAEVNRLKEYFEKKEKLEIDVHRYAMLAGYLIDKGKTEDVQPLLTRAMKANPNVAEVHYQFARLFRTIGKARDERIALDRTLNLYQEKEKQNALTRKEIWKLIDTYRRDGDYRLERREVLEAERSYQEGIRRYEEAVSTRLLKPNPTLGLLYVGLGNLYYYEGQKFQEALAQYTKAEASFVQDPEVSYRKGYILYFFGNYEQAILEFLKTESKFPEDRNVLFALATALYQRNDYAAASGYYQYLVEKLTQDRSKIRFLEPHLKPEDRALVVKLMKTYNNLGVTLKRLGDRTRRPNLTSEALVFLTDAIELYENFSRDRETKVRGETKNLAYLNMRKILNPTLPYDLQIYPSIPIDLRNQEF
ncbi:MAG: tetratricopeptide repeat protein [Spirochaetes bacterium]|nr:tetratricopeptide repeat protein [Spirochaetota bacterium]